jgi:hypothetical protein
LRERIVVLSKRQRSLLSLAGALAGALGVVFVALKLVEYRDRIPLADLTTHSWLALVILTLVSGTAGILLALAWRELLGHFDVTVGRRWAIRIYGISQLAKYVPGNVVHIAGRQAMGAAANLPNWPLAKSAIWEIAVITATGCLFVLLTLPLILPISAALAFASFAGALALYIWIVASRYGRHLARAVAIHAGFLVVSGFVFFSLVSLFTQAGQPLQSLALQICGAYVLATVAGIVTPGAPAGFGVRETVLYALLQHSIAQPDLLAAILFSRAITLTGDVFFYAISSLLPAAKSAKND